MKADLTNQTFGLLIAREIVGKDKRGYLWRCECECGGEKIVPASYLRNKHTTSCGCIVRNNREGSIKKGDRWDRLEAVEFVEYQMTSYGKRRAVWRFKCDCGNEKIMPVANVKFGNVRSCGCKAKEHISNLRKEDITDKPFGRLRAIRPTQERDNSGGIIWELQCECGNLVYKTVNELKSGRVLSCGCLYKESRKNCTYFRKDIVEDTSISNIVVSKRPRSTNSSGHTGVWHNPKTGCYEAYINYQKKRHRLGCYENIEDAICARQAAERQFHDPVVLEHRQDLTSERQKEFGEYLKSIGASAEFEGFDE